MAQHIIVTEYNPLWSEMFKSESEIIKQILGNNCIEVHHIGSTAVPGLKAKPIIDIMPIVVDIQKVDSVASEFEKSDMNIGANSVYRAEGTCAKAAMKGPTKFISLKLPTRPI